MIPSEIELAISRLVAQCFIKAPTSKHHGNASNGNRAIMRERTERQKFRQWPMDGEEVKSFSRLRGLKMKWMQLPA